MQECVFCQIVAGEKDTHILYSDDHAVAFLDDSPATEGHTLVIPKGHRERLFATDELKPVAIFSTVERVAKGLDRTLNPDGFSLFYTSGPLVGHVRHAHVHLLPRYDDDSIGFGLERRPLEDGGVLADRIRSNI